MLTAFLSSADKLSGTVRPISRLSQARALSLSEFPLHVKMHLHPTYVNFVVNLN